MVLEDCERGDELEREATDRAPEASNMLELDQEIDDDVFYLFLQKQKSAQNYKLQGYFPPYEADATGLVER